MRAISRPRACAPTRAPSSWKWPISSAWRTWWWIDVTQIRFAYTGPMSAAPRYQIQVEVRPRFVDDPSAAERGRYAFAYDIRILNTGDIGARLMARHWEIDHGNG